MKIISAIKYIDHTILSIDKDSSVCESIKYVTETIRKNYGPDTKIIFGKWGDRFTDNIPEVQVCRDLWVEIKDWLWAKIHNSSDYRAKIK